MKRRLLIVAVFLLAGAVVNVAVAWTLAVRVTPPSPFTTDPTYEGVYEGADDSQWWWCQVVLRPGHEQVVWERPHVVTTPIGYSGEEVNENLQSDLRSWWAGRRLSDWLRSRGLDTKDPTTWPNEPGALRPYLEELIAIQNRPPERIDEDLIPSWAGTPHSIETRGRIRCAFGWPRVAMWHEQRLPKAMFDFQIVTAGGLRLADSFGFLGPGRIIPYGIIARGFAINTLFYAAVLWLMIPGPFALRRFIRVRRGLCPACAYPRGEADVCSECGIPLVP